MPLAVMAPLLESRAMVTAGWPVGTRTLAHATERRFPCVRGRDKLQRWNADRVDRWQVRSVSRTGRTRPVWDLLLIACDPKKFVTTDHYDGHSIMLVNLDEIDMAETREVLTDSWRVRAPKKLVKEWDNSSSAGTKP